MHLTNDSLSVRAAVLTVSDTRTEAEDKSGRIIKTSLQQSRHETAGYAIVRDEVESIQKYIIQWRDNASIDAVIINGGTGFSPRDVTYEAVAGLLHKKMDGFGELFRMLSYDEIGAKAMFSRAAAGSSDATAIYALPGSSNAVRLGMEKLILPTISHFTEELKKQ
ncbi:molybdenum cofactor biosynthesis protein B [Alteribacillus sp. HJP-4]|uniref:MogA/MoaB family molybdenum cofactor biosynthesis protein n=1 Tax=Alteribacillus sp. HJP-4 TaxID=2775394 RepID=UPI0035CCE061